MTISFDPAAEWLETDGRGGFASGTVSGRRTRRYHALLLVATTPPTGRFVLVNGFDAWVETNAGTFAISSQLYAPDVVAPDGEKRLVEFGREPWPTWTFQLEDGTVVEHDLFVPRGHSTVALAWRLREGSGGAQLHLRPFLSGRDYHSLAHENPDFSFDARQIDGRIVWQPYAHSPTIWAWSNARYDHHPLWYRNFLYEAERQRGLDDTEDLASPGEFHWDLTAGRAVLLLRATSGERDVPLPGESAEQCFQELAANERTRRGQFASPLERAADACLVRRDSGQTIIAGYPWFTDWGRDTFIAMRGLCLATGRLDAAREILLAWANTVSEGMLPNRFPDDGGTPEFNSVDASLWFVVVVHEFLQESWTVRNLSPDDRQTLQAAIEAILAGYTSGTRYSICCDDDGLLAAGEPGVQLTWMDAKVGDWIVTPRIGKPVEVQALWLNALWIGSQFNPHWQSPFEAARAAFTSRFWNPDRGCLYDVVDVDHQAGVVDASLRPNQVLAVGGLPLMLLDEERARRVVDLAEQQLLTRLGLRSLAPGEPGYVGRYRGDVAQRDRAYHQGTVWPWLLGIFVEAWVRVRGTTTKAKQAAREKFLPPLEAHLQTAGLGHISEIAHGDPPHTPAGCPFQAWSLGEFLRLKQRVLA
ncbi:MAG: glycogen debranching enzyme N-terminal domain-containing protein [Planctomycetota bacterium]|nr:glycogen debranching enzyme N-terminal domain-containing protein [Planctomycetota bacterium]